MRHPYPGDRAVGGLTLPLRLEATRVLGPVGAQFERLPPMSVRNIVSGALTRK
jgi:hypothetical protein